jgi:hypothetical protein
MEWEIYSKILQYDYVRIYQSHFLREIGELKKYENKPSFKNIKIESFQTSMHHE